MNGYDYSAYDRSTQEMFLSYASKHAQIYLWGAGRFGRNVKRYLERLGLNISGFLLSDTTQTSSIVVDSVPVVSFDRVKHIDGLGIILSLSPDVHHEILDYLSSQGFSDCLIPDLLMYRHIVDANRRLSKKEAIGYASRYPQQPFRDEKISCWKNILVICLDNIGDVIMNVPFLRELRRNSAPDTHITVVVQPIVGQFMQLCPYVDDVVIYSLKDNEGMDVQDCARKSMDFADKFLWGRPYDVVFLQGWYQTHLEYLFLAVFSPAKMRIGFSEENMPAKSFYNVFFDQFLSLAVKSRDVMHEVERNLVLVKVLGGTVKNTDLEFWVQPKDEEYAERIFREHAIDSHDVIIALVPHANDSRRMWDRQKYLNFMQEFLHMHQDAVFLVFGGNSAEYLGEYFADHLPKHRLINLTGKTTIRESAALLKKCQLYVGCNTGLTHIAAAWKIPTVEIICHSPQGDPLEHSSPDRYVAWGTRSYIVRPEKPLDGCGGSCYAGGAHCINQISVEEVVCTVNKAVQALFIDGTDVT